MITEYQITKADDIDFILSGLLRIENGSSLHLC